MFKRRQHQQPLSFSPEDILPGLAPALVEDLAQLVGSTEEDLLVTFQMLPYGDRATLAAYGVIELGEPTNGRRRVVRVAPSAVELVNYAAEELSAARRNASEPWLESLRALRTSRLVSAAVPLVTVVDESAPPLDHQIRGLIIAVGVDRVTVQVPIQDDGSEVDVIQIAPDGDLGDEGTHVILKYDSPGSVLTLPEAVARDHLVGA